MNLPLYSKKSLRRILERYRSNASEIMEEGKNYVTIRHNSSKKIQKKENRLGVCNWDSLRSVVLLRIVNLSDKIIFDGREKTMITSLQMSFSVRDARPQFCRPSTTFRLARNERSSTALVDTL